MRGLEPRLSTYLTSKNIKNQNRLIKHQLFTSEVDVESWLTIYSVIDSEKCSTVPLLTKWRPLLGVFDESVKRI